MAASRTALVGWNSNSPGGSGTTTSVFHGGTASYQIGDVAATPAVLSQVVATQVGKTYTLTFYAATGATSSETPNNLAVSFGGTTVFSQALTSSTFTKFTMNVTATSGASALVFTGSNDPDYSYLDDVSLVAAAPEPSEVAAFGLGILGLAGLSLKARKRGSVTA